MDISSQFDNMDIILEFVRDCRDLIEDLEVSVIGFSEALEAGSIEREHINKVFRTFHSIKGGAGFLMLNNIKEVAHAAENLLDLIRSGELEIKKDHIDLFVLASDFIKDAIEEVNNKFSDESLKERGEAIKNIISLAINESNEETANSSFGIWNENIAENKEDVSGKNLLFNSEFISQFIAESIENIKEIESSLIEWSENEANIEALAKAYRTVHTFKGNSGFLGFKDFEVILHKIENILDAAISGAPLNNTQIVKILLSVIDVIEEAVNSISSGGTGSIEKTELYIELIDDLLPKSWLENNANTPRVGEILKEKGLITDEHIETALEIQRRPIGEILIDLGAVEKSAVEEALKEQKEKKSELIVDSKSNDKLKQNDKKQDIRVDVSKLDSLINLIGELVISHNMIVHNPEIAHFNHIESFTKASQQMGKIVRELQEIAMFIRMVPVAGLFKRMIRLVHDLSTKSGKKVDLQLFGEETEIDKTVVEIITDPLVHIIRNAIDHGLETTEEREKAGKPPKGLVRLTAKHEEGEVWIIIEDDGRGINREKVLKKAIEKGLVQGDPSLLTDKEICQFIFHPGFSTADKITDISGRGVGMDVVKKNLEKIKGRVDVESVFGKGTRVTLRIPLTLAIIEGMQVRVGKSLYIIPLLSIRQFFKASKSNITTSPDGSETVKIRDELLPVVRLHKLHNIKSDFTEISDGILVIIESNNKTCALFVDQIIGQQQTVIKGLSEYIGHVKGVSGCTILGDGGISLILDVDAIFDIEENV